MPSYPGSADVIANLDTVLWMEELPAPESGASGAATPLPPRPGPIKPKIDVQSDAEPELTGDDF